MILKIKTLDTIRLTARQFVKEIGSGTVFAINGNMGAGKTTFIKAVCEELGVIETINSPTFSIVNEYKTIDGRIIYHFDFYRITKIEDALEIGVEDYLYSGNICFLEWSENINSLLPHSTINIKIEENDDNSRNIYTP